MQTEQVKCAALQRQLSTTTAEMDRLVEHQKRVREMHDAAYQDAAIAKKLYAENIRLELKEMRDRLFHRRARAFWLRARARAVFTCARA